MAKAKAGKPNVQAVEGQAEQPKKRKCKECGVSAVPVVNSRDQVRCEACYEIFPPEA